MPYTTRGKCVYKKDTGEKVGCTDGSVKKYLAALHANVKTEDIRLEGIPSYDDKHRRGPLVEIVAAIRELEYFSRGLDVYSSESPLPKLESIGEQVKGLSAFVEKTIEYVKKHPKVKEGTMETLPPQISEKREKLKCMIREMIEEVLTEKPTNPKTGEVLNRLEDIPNQVGVKITAVFRDGTELKTIVQKRLDGTHHLTGVSDWSKMLGWKPRT